MEEQKQTIRVPIKEINKLVKNRPVLHHELNKKYLLPRFGSKAASEEYLKKILLANQTILKIEREKTNDIYVPEKLSGKNASELLEILEKFLVNNKLPPTGIPAGSESNP